MAESHMRTCLRSLFQSRAREGADSCAKPDRFLPGAALLRGSVLKHVPRLPAKCTASDWRVGLSLWILFVVTNPPVSAGSQADRQVPDARPVATHAGSATDFDRLMNLGKAHLENRDSAKAIETLTRAVAKDPESPLALRNLARAHFLARKFEKALASLSKAAKIEPESVAAGYLSGLSLFHLSRFEEAIPYFERAVSRDPHTPALRYQLAGAYQAVQQHVKAQKQLEETARLDPLHASAHFKLGTYARMARDTKEFKRRMDEFLRLRKLFGDENRSVDALERCLYTLAEPLPTDGDRSKRPPPIDVRFTDATQQVIPQAEDRSAVAATVLEVDEGGRCTLFTAGPDGRTGLLTLSSAGTLVRSAWGPKLADVSGVETCVTGNFYDAVPEGAAFDHKIHARNDVLIVARTGVTLLQRVARDEAGLFDDVTQSAGLTGIGADRVVWVDYEHDGDLDLVLARETGLELWQNNGDGRFQNVTEQVGIQAGGTFLDVAAIDLDNDVAVDLIAARGEAPTMVFENQRAGRFARMPEPPGPWPAATRVLVNDLNNDSYADVVLLNPTAAVVLLGRKTHRPRIDLGAILPADAKLLDYDNDGWLDLCVVGSNRSHVDQGAVQLWRNVAGDRSGIPEWVNVSKETGLAGIALPPVKEVIPLDVDGDGDTDLLLLTADSQLRVLRNDGGHANGQLKIRLTTIKTNASGIGTHTELRDRGRFLTRTVTRLPIEIGLGGLTHLDSLQTLWTNGVVQNRIDVELTATPLTILEKNVATGSCPFLYAWDGRRFRFVTDLLGNSPIGLPLTRKVLLPADPDEIVLLGDAGIFQPRDGAYVLKITDEFREVLYLDQVKLLAVDHPLDIEVHPTDKLMPEPFPPSEVWGLGSPRRLVLAMGDDGIDRTEAVRAIDGVFASPGAPLPPPFRGMCHPMTLTMDFGEIDATRPLVLALTGWLQYGDASTNIALSQGSTLEIIQPALEAQTSSGRWLPVEGVVGMPAGKTKTILMDLTGRLEKGVRRLRLTTTFEIRWDRIALFERVALDAQQTHKLLPTGAELQWRGFSELISRGPGHPTTPDHDSVTDRPAWRTAQEGWCTRYGDVLELIRQRDDRLAILNAGDALTLRFDASTLPPVPAGLARTFFLYSVGWDKDGDPNVTTGQTVAPLPRNDPNQSLLMSGPHDDWDHRYNTRWVPRNRFTPAR